MSAMTAAALKTALDSSNRQKHALDIKTQREQAVSNKVNTARHLLSRELKKAMDDFTKTTGLHVSSVSVGSRLDYGSLEIRFR